ncbi:MAG: beta-galactosidase [Candidatus Paceibacterota bacterium]
MISLKGKQAQKKERKKKANKTVLLIVALFILFSLIIFFIYSPRNSQVTYGVTFSKPFSESMGMDWKENYLALLDDLEVKRLRIPVYWTEIEAQEGEYRFENIDWQIEEAAKRNAKIVFVVGQKQPRWPECHIPEWVNELNDEQRESEIEETLTTVINRYKNNPAISAWQVENEPFLPYGECPIITKKLLDKEIEIVRELDSSRPIIITDSGELSTWYDAASRSDILGTTLYRIVWNDRLGYVHYPISSLFYRFKAAFIMYFTNVQKIIIVELQGEPWGPTLILDMPLEEQRESMNAEQFSKNIEFVKNVEFSEAYLWGGEWWYWLKTVKGDDSLWEEARKIF